MVEAGAGGGGGVAQQPPSFRLIFEAFPGLCIVVDPSFRIIAVTDALLANTQATREDLLGKVLYEAFPDNPDDPTAQGARNLRASLERVRESLEPDIMPVQKYDVRRPDAEGGGFEERYWTPTNSPVLQDGRLAFIVQRVEDITAYVRMTEAAEERGDRAAQLQAQADTMEAELVSRRDEVARASRELKENHAELERLYAKAKELDELKSSFFANVSHELRTPLTLILGPTQRVLADADLPDEHRRQLEVVLRNAGELLQRVNDLLEASRLEAGGVSLSYQEVDLGELVRFTASQFESMVADRGTELIVLAPEGVVVQVDPEKVQRMVLNLVGNAVKFTPDGGVIRVQLHAALDGLVRIEVADTGPGVPAEHRERVFERFHQVESSIRRAHGGTGLGLAIAHELAALLGGSLVVGTAAEGGACFVVTLPVMAPEGVTVEPARRMPSYVTVPAPRAAAVPTGAASAMQPLILVVDDQPEMRRFVADELAAVARVVVAANGAAALELAREHLPDLVVTDLMMPIMSGDELLRAIRADPLLGDTPVVLLTAKADEELRVQLLREGASDYVMKPFSAEELRVRVSNLLSQQAAHRALRDASLRDPLTGLANRVLLLDHLELGLAELERTRGHLGVLFIDLDGFKEVNDVHGHQVGDAVLVETARRLQHAVRPGDTIARLGGDEFVAVCPEIEATSTVGALADRVRAAFSEPMVLDELRLSVAASVGTAATSSPRESAEALLAAADTAMYEAKRRGDPTAERSTAAFAPAEGA